MIKDALGRDIPDYIHHPGCDGCTGNEGFQCNGCGHTRDDLWRYGVNPNVELGWWCTDCRCAIQHWLRMAGCNTPRWDANHELEWY